MRWRHQGENKPEEWHPWFAWRPVRIEDETVWLEWIERKRSVLSDSWAGTDWCFLYRNKIKDKNDG